MKIKIVDEPQQNTEQSESHTKPTGDPSVSLKPISKIPTRTRTYFKYFAIFTPIFLILLFILAATPVRPFLPYIIFLTILAILFVPMYLTYQKRQRIAAENIMWQTENDKNPMQIRTQKRNEFIDRYNLQNISFAPSMLIRSDNRSQKTPNYYYLSYPQWKAANKDGTKDPKCENNEILTPQSCLYIDNYAILTTDPYEMIQLVNYLRKQGAEIQLNSEELKKQKANPQPVAKIQTPDDIQAVIDQCRAHKSISEKIAFKTLCRDMFASLGYDASLHTIVSNDEYDIQLQSKSQANHDPILVKCWLCEKDYRLGRTIIQRFYNANPGPASRRIFITTGGFSETAILCAKELGIELINGDRLYKILKKQNLILAKSVKVNAAVVPNYQLSLKDIKPYIPADIFDMRYQHL